MPKLILLIAATNGFIAVALGAFAAHGLRNRLPVDMLQVFQTGVQYQMTHSLALFGVAVLALHYPGSTVLRSSAYLFIAGIILFSGSLYILSLSGVRWLGAVTPLGGLCFLAAWSCLGWFALRTDLSVGP